MIQITSESLILFINGTSRSSGVDLEQSPRIASWLTVLNIKNLQLVIEIFGYFRYSLAKHVIF